MGLRDPEPAARAPHSSVPVMAADHATVGSGPADRGVGLSLPAGNLQLIVSVPQTGSPPWRAGPASGSRRSDTRSDSREHHLHHGNTQQINRPPTPPLALQRHPALDH